MAAPSDGLGFPERMANILPSLVLMYVPAAQMTEYEANKPYLQYSKHSQQFSKVPLDPRITWILSPAPIRAWTSVLLLDPGITISEKQRHETMRKQTETSNTARSSMHYKWKVCTSGGDDTLYVNAGLLQVVDGESCAWTGDAHGYLAGHHGNGRGLNWPHACDWFLF